MPQQVRLLRSEMTETIYAVTKYRELGEGRFEALTKHDVTHDFYEILDAITGGADKST